jgi:hypothetical protein
VMGKIKKAAGPKHDATLVRLDLHHTQLPSR